MLGRDEKQPLGLHSSHIPAPRAPAPSSPADTTASPAGAWCCQGLIRSCGCRGVGHLFGFGPGSDALSRLAPLPQVTATVCPVAVPGRAGAEGWGLGGPHSARRGGGVRGAWGAPALPASLSQVVLPLSSCRDGRCFGSSQSGTAGTAA